MAVDAASPDASDIAGDAAPSATRRALFLSAFGLMVAGILVLLQAQRGEVEQDVIAIMATFLVWACAAALIGILYPLADNWMYGRVHDFKQDWSNAIRSVAILVGIHQASTKIPFSNYYELIGTLIFLAVGLWWMSDRSRCGFFLALLLSLLGVTISMVKHSAGYSTSGGGFLYISEWCICYSASITFGSIGRILAMPPGQRAAAASRQYISDKLHVE